jgi:hypothetical protein
VLNSSRRRKREIGKHADTGGGEAEENERRERQVLQYETK